jgi:hypothetical protein
MIICNKKVFEFYNNNTALDFEQISLLCVELFENILQDATANINKSISSQILFECIENKNKIHELQTTTNTNLQMINSNLSKITGDITLKLLDIKKEYIEEIKTIIGLNSSNLNDRFRETLERNNIVLTNDFSNKMDKSNTTLTNDISNKLDKSNIILTTDISNKLDRSNTTLTNDISNKMDKLHLLFHELNKENSTKMISLFDSTNNNIVDKTTLLVNQLIPENNKANKQLQEDINKFYSTILGETKQIITDNKQFDKHILELVQLQNERKGTETIDKEKTDKLLFDMNAFLSTSKMETLIHNFEIKYESLISGIHQPILQVISLNDEKINKNINKQQETQEKMLLNLDDFLNKYKNNSSLKGKFSENHLHKVLVHMFPTSEIIDTSKQSHFCDILLKRENKSDILFENKDYADNVSSDEIRKFAFDCETHKINGIMLSQNTGIIGKPNYHIDIVKNKVLVYIHNVDYSSNKIQIAIDIIDTLTNKLKEFDEESDDASENENIISQEVLLEINNEMNKFATHKETIINMIKESHKRIIDEVKIISIPSLDKYLFSKFGSSKTTYPCKICNLFVGNCERSLRSHQKGKECKSKIQITESKEDTGAGKKKK